MNIDDIHISIYIYIHVYIYMCAYIHVHKKEPLNMRVFGSPRLEQAVRSPPRGCWHLPRRPAAG